MSQNTVRYWSIYEAKKKQQKKSTKCVCMNMELTPAFIGTWTHYQPNWIPLLTIFLCYLYSSKNGNLSAAPIQSSASIENNPDRVYIQAYRIPKADQICRLIVKPKVFQTCSPIAYGNILSQ